LRLPFCGNIRERDVQTLLHPQALLVTHPVTLPITLQNLRNVLEESRRGFLDRLFLPAVQKRCQVPRNMSRENIVVRPSFFLRHSRILFLKAEPPFIRRREYRAKGHMENLTSIGIIQECTKVERCVTLRRPQQLHLCAHMVRSASLS